MQCSPTVAINYSDHCFDVEGEVQAALSLDSQEHVDHVFFLPGGDFVRLMLLDDRLHERERR
jgi:hypothetical protein